MSAELRVEKKGATLVLTLSNPGLRNSGTPEIYAAGAEALASLQQDASVRAVILTGADGTFCSGGNVKRLADNRKNSPAAQAEAVRLLSNWVSAIRSCPKPVIAAVEGAAAGAGFSLALACDFMVAARDSKFILSHVKIALSPDGGGSWFLPRSLPRALAMEFAMCGEMIAAERLWQLGMINRLVEPGAALEEAHAWANKLSALSTSAVSAIKRLVDLAGEQNLTDHLQSEQESFLATFSHDDCLEGINAFLEKRPPAFD